MASHCFSILSLPYLEAKMFQGNRWQRLSDLNNRFAVAGLFGKLANFDADISQETVFKKQDNQETHRERLDNRREQVQEPVQV